MINDNRNYQFAPESISKRAEYSLISELIKSGSSVIDLGCGDGSLLKMLEIEKHTKGIGMEISQSGVNAAKLKGLSAIKGKIDEKLPFKNKEFDYAICNVTLQMVMYPEILLLEMGRVSKKQIITFPNFAFILNRAELLLKGRMPKTMIPGYSWYSTGHIHQLSLRDFKEFCQANGLEIIGSNHVFPLNSPWLKPIFRTFPNLFVSTAVFLTR